MMSKLSGILPATPRILSTDTSRAQPLRSGAPRFWGMPEVSEPLSRSILAESALDRVSWSPNGRQDLADKNLPVRADDFFLRQLEPMDLTDLGAPIDSPTDFSGPSPAAPAPSSSDIGRHLNLEA